VHKKSGVWKSGNASSAAIFTTLRRGDPENDVPPGTPFEQLPGDWVCPVCGADKSRFEKLSSRRVLKLEPFGFVINYSA